MRGYFSTHAECNAIVNARGVGDVLVVVRVARKDGSYTCSRPCDKCIEFAREHGIKKVYFYSWDKKIELIKL